MRRILKAFLALAFIASFCGEARAEPWIVHAQSVIPKDGVVQNPTPFNVGLVGEIHALPYTVPAGKVLHLKRSAIEPLWGAAFIFWIGDGDHDLAESLGTFASAQRYHGTDTEKQQWMQPTIEWAHDYYIPAGKTLNIRVSANYQDPGDWIYGWEVSGELLNAEYP